MAWSSTWDTPRGLSMARSVGRQMGMPGARVGRHPCTSGGTALAPHRARAWQALFQRDPAFIERQLALMARYTSFFSPEVKALENLPATGPVLVVGNHSCLCTCPTPGSSPCRSSGGAASISPRTPSPMTCSSACPVWARSCGGSAPSRRGTRGRTGPPTGRGGGRLPGRRHRGLPALAPA